MLLVTSHKVVTSLLNKLITRESNYCYLKKLKYVK